MEIRAKERNESRTKTKQRERILTSARGLFLEKGIASTSIVDVAKHADIGRRTIYNYYATKEEIAVELQIAYLKEMTDYFKEIVHDAGLTGYQELEQFTDTFVDFSFNHVEMMRFFNHFDYHFRNNYENVEIYPYYIKTMLSENHMIHGILKKGVEDRSITLMAEDVEGMTFHLTQSIMAIVSRFIFRESIFNEEFGDIDKGCVKQLINGMLLAMKKK